VFHWIQYFISTLHRHRAAVNKQEVKVMGIFHPAHNVSAMCHILTGYKLYA